MSKISNVWLSRAILGFAVVVSLIATPSRSFAPVSSPESFVVRHQKASNSVPLTRLFMFDWVNDMFGNNSKQAEEEAVAKAKAEAQQKAEEAAVAAAAAAAEAETKRKAEEEEKAKRQVEEAAVIATTAAEAEEESTDTAAKATKEKEVIASKTVEATENSTGVENGDSVVDDLIAKAIKDKSRITGSVKWYNPRKGYGFIRPIKTEEEKELSYTKDFFVHHTKIKAPDDTVFRRLYPLEAVEFEITQDKQGRLNAENVAGIGGDYVRHIKEQKDAQNGDNDKNK